MRTVLFRMYDERGHLTPAFTLARKLRDAAAVRVVFVAAAEFKTEIERLGFVFEEAMPFERPGAHFEVALGHVPKRWLDRARCLGSGLDRQLACRFDSYVQSLNDKYDPDLWLIDELHVHYVIALHGKSVPCFTLSTYLLSYEELGVPPPNSALIPDGAFATKVRTRLQWRHAYVKRWLSQLRLWLSLPGGNYYYRRLAQQVGYPYAGRITGRKYYWIDDERTPKLVMCPPHFDFPRLSRPNVHFIEACVDTSRAANSFDWTRVSPNPRVVYCALGTQSHKHAAACHRFLERVVTVCGRLPDVSLVVATGPLKIDPAVLARTNNVAAFESVPQLEILQRASVMITHGGLGSVKECLQMGVPMLVYPINPDVDQRGNAARVVFHRLGLRGELEQDRECDIHSKLEHLLSTSEYRHNVLAMRREMARWESREPFMTLVEPHLPDSLERPLRHLPRQPCAAH
jgi:zeaxanthin glucosyltransferase